MNDSAREASPVYRLSDAELVSVIRGRGNDLDSAKRLAFLVKMFEAALKSNPSLAPGLRSAIGLTHLYGLSIASGHAEHPFKNVDHNMTVASILTTAAAEVRPVKVQHDRFVDPAGSRPSLPNVKKHNGPRGPRATSKSALARNFILVQTGEFKIADIRTRDSSLCDQDVINGLVSFVKDGTVVRIERGLYRVRTPMTKEPTP